ncbi:CLUMA_CG009857, isoform A, partial [Clunio marinus]
MILKQEFSEEASKISDISKGMKHVDNEALIKMTNQRIKTELRSCTACGDPIADRYLLEVGGCTWHGSC